MLKRWCWGQLPVKGTKARVKKQQRGERDCRQPWLMLTDKKLIDDLHLNALCLYGRRPFLRTSQGFTTPDVNVDFKRVSDRSLGQPITLKYMTAGFRDVSMHKVQI